MSNSFPALHQHALEAIGTALALNLLSTLCPPHRLLVIKHYRIKFFDGPARRLQSIWFKLRLPFRIFLLFMSIYFLYGHATYRCIVIGFLTSSGAHTYFSQAAELRQLAQQSLSHNKTFKVFTKETAPKAYEPSPAHPPKHAVSSSASSSLSTPSLGTKPFVPIPSPFAHIEPPKHTPTIIRTPPSDIAEPLPILPQDECAGIRLEGTTSPPPVASTSHDTPSTSSLAIHVSVSNKRKHSSPSNSDTSSDTKPQAKHGRGELHVSSSTAFSATHNSTDNTDDTSAVNDDHMQIEDSFVTRMMTSLKRRFSVSNEESQNRALEICAPKENTSQDDIHPADTPATARDSAPSSLKRRKTSDASASVFSGLLPSKRLAQFLQQHSNNSTALVPSMASNSYDTMHHRPNITKISQKQTVDGIADASEQQLLEQHKRVRSNVTEKAQKLLKGALSQFSKPVGSSSAKSSEPPLMSSAVTPSATAPPALSITVPTPPSSTPALVLPTIPVATLSTTSSTSTASATTKLSDSTTSSSSAPPVSSSPPTHPKKPPPSPSGSLARKKSLDHSTMGIAFIAKPDEKEHQHVLASLAADPSVSFALPPPTSSLTTATITPPADSASGVTSNASSSGLSGAIAASTANLPFGTSAPAPSNAAQFSFGAPSSAPSANFMFGNSTNSAPGSTGGGVVFGTSSGNSSIESFENPGPSLGGGTSAFPLGTSSNASKPRKRVTIDEPMTCK